MEITRKNWKSYAELLSKIDDEAGDLIIDYLSTHEILTDQGFSDFIDYMYAVVTKYGEASAELSCLMYEATAEAAGVSVPAAVPAETASYQEVQKAVRGSMLRSTQDTVLAQQAKRLTKMAGVDTTMQNALRDGAEWAWIPNGDTCAFCLTLASRGWQRASKKAIKNGHAEHIHANCDCTYAIRFDGKSTVEGYDPDELLDRYNAADGDTPQERINSLRREIRAENPEKYRLQNRLSYARNTDFYTGPNKQTMEAKYANWIGDSKRDEYLSIGSNERYIDAIEQLYRPGSFIGDGGTADALRFEKETGLNLGRRGSHLQKAEDRLKYINNKVLKEDLTDAERKTILSIRDDLERAIKNFKK